MPGVMGILPENMLQMNTHSASSASSTSQSSISYVRIHLPLAASFAMTVQVTNGPSSELARIRSMVKMAINQSDEKDSVRARLRKH